MNDKESYFSTALMNAEKEVYREAMEFSNGNQSKATRLLGVSRVTLRTKLKQHGLFVPLRKGK